MRLIGFSSMLSLLAVRAALAGEPYVFRHNFNGGSWEFDISSVVLVNEGFRQSQMQLHLEKPLQDQATGSLYNRITFFYEHDCALNRMRVLDSVAGLSEEAAAITRPGDDWQPAGDSFAQKYACALAKRRWKTDADVSSSAPVTQRAQ
jgi:hypothetical protein